MERYNRVEKPKLGSPINENEIRITSLGLIRNYISYATTLLHEKGVKDIVLKAMGQAISKTVAISEILKSKIPGLHQDVAISSMSITDVFEPIEEGLVPVELIRHVSMIYITLSLTKLNHDSPGYQAPAQIDQSKPQYQPNQARLSYNAYCEDSYGRGRGRGRGRGGYGYYQGRSYQGKYQDDYQENDGGYSNLDRGRGRSYGYHEKGGRGSYGGGRDGGYGGRIGGRYGGGRDGTYGGAKSDGYVGGSHKGFGGVRDDGYGGREDGYGRRFQGYVGAKDDGYGGRRDHGYGGGRDQRYSGRRGGFRGGYKGDRYLGRDGGYGGGRGGYGRYEDQGDGYEGGRGRYGGGRGYGRGRGRMGNGGRSRGGASHQNQA